MAGAALQVGEQPALRGLAPSVRSFVVAHVRLGMQPAHIAFAVNSRPFVARDGERHATHRRVLAGEQRHGGQHPRDGVGSEALKAHGVTRAGLRHTRARADVLVGARGLHGAVLAFHEHGGDVIRRAVQRAAP